MPRAIARVLPLWLPEWRNGKSLGSLEVHQRGLVLEQKGVQRLFSPLFIDLSPKRVAKPLTWRQLSVGYLRENVPLHQAVGYRIQVGREQWLLYRSLTDPVSRTLLGQNLLCELHMSRFLDSGDVEELIEVQ